MWWRIPSLPLEHDRQKRSHCRDLVSIVNRPLFQKNRAYSCDTSEPFYGSGLSRSALVLFLATIAVLAFHDAVEAADRCVHLVTRADGRVMVNSCNACRTIKIERRRPGGTVPSYRNYTLAPKSTTHISLRGGGRTRIVGDKACETASGTAPGPQQPQGPCISITRKRTGEPVLFNQCGLCRTVILEHLAPDGNRTREVLRVLGNSLKRLNPKGAIQTRIVAQPPCRK